VEKDSDRDYWMTADEAKEYGIIDDVLSKHPRKQENNPQ
jgi:ATP-dependent Clp protease protease subunit